MNICNYIIDDQTACDNSASLNLVFDDKLYRVCGDCYSSITSELKFSSSPQNVKVRVFTNRIWTDKEIEMLGSYK